MSWIVTGGKRLFTILLMIIISLSFVSGFLMGDKYGEYIEVFDKRLVPIYKVDRQDGKISLTFDGTWGAEYTEELLDILASEDIKASFFFAGYWLEKYPGLVKKIAAAGHDVENHSFTHPHCSDLTADELKAELESTSDLIESLIGKRPRFFRPPYGDYNNTVINIAENLGYQVIQWSLDSLDWQERGRDFILNRIVKNVSDGDIILMHNNAPHTTAALKFLIPRLKEMGYKPVPLSQLVYEKDYYIQSHDGLQVKQGAADE